MTSEEIKIIAHVLHNCACWLSALLGFIPGILISKSMNWWKW